jgi:hypothetical protein
MNYARATVGRHRSHQRLRKHRAALQQQCSKPQAGGGAARNAAEQRIEVWQPTSPEVAAQLRKSG